MQSFRILAVWLAFAAAGWAALRPGSLAGYTAHVWQVSDGLPEQTVQAFAQSPDGYLWIGTTGGLVRFDGAHFTIFDRQNTPSLRENSVFCLMVSRDGALWIGTEGGGLARYAEGKFRTWTTREGLSNDFVRTLMQNTAGNIWAGTDNGLLRLEGDRFSRVDGTGQIPALAVHAIFQDREGGLWVGGSRLIRIENGQAAEYTLRGEPSQNRVKSIAQTADGAIWVGTISGLNRMLPGQRTFTRVPGVDGTVRVLRQSQDGRFWIGTIGLGAYTWKDGVLSQVTAPVSLPSNTVLNFFEDSEKNIWIGTQTGMVRLTRSEASVVPLPQANDADFGTIYQDRDGSFWIGSSRLFRMRDGSVHAETLQGLDGLRVRNVYRDREGALWVGTDGGGVFRIAGGRKDRLTTREGLSNNFVRAMEQDRDGSMWIATDEGLNHVIPSGLQLRVVSYGMHDGLAYFSTRAVLEDRDGDLWIGTDRGLSHLHRGGFQSDAATETLAQMKIWAIHQDSDGSLWFGTRNNGLFRYRGGKLAQFTTADGLADNAIYQIFEDDQDHFWISGPNGISLLDRRELDAQADLSPRHLALTFYSTADMAANTEIYGGTQPSGCITAKGEAWFPSSLGPIHILPPQRAPLPPPSLRILSVLADGRPAALPGPIVLQPGSSRLAIDFTPIRLGSQDGLRFRYRLDGFENQWSAPTTARTADYTNLPAGRYGFRVETYDVGRPDLISDISLEIVQRPFFYRTWWFVSGCIALLALLVFGAYQYRVRQVRGRFEAVLEERSRLAREMHDTVIQGCTGVSALLEALSMNRGSEGVELMDFARMQLRATINEARDAIWNLRKPAGEPASLGEKLESMTRQVGNEFQLPVQWSMQGTPFAVSDPVAHDLLMVAREGVSNSMLHARASHVEVALTYEDKELILHLADDGCGFDPALVEAGNGHHFGLKGMKERVERCGGSLTLSAAPTNGVQIEVRIPRQRRDAWNTPAAS